MTGTSRPGSGARRGTSTRRPARAASSARPPAPSPCRTSSTPTSSRAARPTSPSRRPCRRRRSSTAGAARRARSRARPASRPTATCRSTRSGEYEEAFQLVLEATPLAGTLGRACYAPCEAECTRGELEGTLPIRRIKRFVDDWHHEHHDGPGVTVPPPNGKRVAIVGSGPAGLTAAWQLARKGYAVRILEAAPEPGGFLRLAIPAYRLPTEVVARDIKNVTDIGVEIVDEQPRSTTSTRSGATGTTRSSWPTGTPRSTAPGHPGRGQGRGPGRRRVPARRPTRPGGRSRGHSGSSWSAAATSPWTPPARPGASAPRASPWPTVAAATRCPPTRPRSTTRSARASQFAFLVAPHRGRRRTATGTVSGLRCTKMALGAPDASGRRRPEPIPGSEFAMDCEVVIAAIGMAPDTACVSASAVTDDGNGTLHADPDDAADRRRRHLRRRRRRDRPDRHHPRHRRGPACRVHDRPLAHRRRDGRLRRPAAGRRQGGRCSPASRRYTLRAPAPVHGGVRPGAARLRRDRAADDRGGGPRGRRRAAWTARSARSARSA